MLGLTANYAVEWKVTIRMCLSFKFHDKSALLEILEPKLGYNSIDNSSFYLKKFAFLDLLSML